MFLSHQYQLFAHCQLLEDNAIVHFDLKKLVLRIATYNVASVIIELDIGHDSPIRQFPVPYPSYIFSLMKFVIYAQQKIVRPCALSTRIQMQTYLNARLFASKTIRAISP